MSMPISKMVCLKCGHQETGQHNQHCPYCPYITMVFEAALPALGWSEDTVLVTTPYGNAQPEVQGQLSLWGTVA